MTVTDPLAEELDMLLDRGDDLQDAPPTDADRVDLDLWIDRRLAALWRITEEVEHNRRVAEARIREVEDWLASENRPLDRKREFLEQQVLAAARNYPYQGRSKSRKLPSGGEIGKRTTPERVAVIDKEAALAFAKAHPALSADVKVEIRESISTTALTNYYRSTGEVPPGCEAVPAEEKPFVRPPKTGT